MNAKSKLVLTVSVLLLAACSKDPVPAETVENPVEPATAVAASEAASKLDLTEFVAEVDMNKDGCMSPDEWFGLGLPESANTMLRDQTGCVTLESMTRVEPPPGIDVDLNGKLSLAEFIAYDKKGPPKREPANSGAASSAAP